MLGGNPRCGIDHQAFATDLKIKARRCLNVKAGDLIVDVAAQSCRLGIAILPHPVMRLADFDQVGHFEHQVHAARRRDRTFADCKTVVAAIGGMEEGEAHARILWRSSHEIEPRHIGFSETNDVAIEADCLGEIGC